MLIIKLNKKNEILLCGRFDASQVDEAKQVFSKISTSSILDFKELEYISSAGLGELLALQKRLRTTGHAVKIINMNDYIRDVFRYAGFDNIFEIDN